MHWQIAAAAAATNNYCSTIVTEPNVIKYTLQSIPFREVVISYLLQCHETWYVWCCLASVEEAPHHHNNNNSTPIIIIITIIIDSYPN